MKYDEVKIGMRVRCVKQFSLARVGEIGTVMDNANGVCIGVKWDRNVDGHDMDGLCDDGHGEWTTVDRLEKVTEEPL